MPELAPRGHVPWAQGSGGNTLVRKRPVTVRRITTCWIAKHGGTAGPLALVSRCGRRDRYSRAHQTTSGPQKGGGAPRHRDACSFGFHSVQRGARVTADASGGGWCSRGARASLAQRRCHRPLCRRMGFRGIRPAGTVGRVGPGDCSAEDSQSFSSTCTIHVSQRQQREEQVSPACAADPVHPMHM